MAEWRHAIRTYPHLLRAAFVASIVYRMGFVVMLLSTTMPLVMLALWAEVARTQPIGGFSSRGFAAYYLATVLVRIATGCWVVYDITNEIRLGTLSYRLLRPIHPLLAYSAENLAEAPMRSLVSVPVVLVLFAAFHREISADAVVWLALLPAVFAAWLLNFLATAMIGMLAFWFDKAMSVFYAYSAVSMVLSGYIVPLDLLPGPVHRLAGISPFRFLLSFPVELMVGRLERGEALRLLGLQWLYAAVALGMVAVLWRRGVRRHGGFGD